MEVKQTARPMPVDTEEVLQESVCKAALMVHRLTEPELTFPSATADVAMSRTKLSLSFAGAATLMGLVPKVHYRQQVQQDENNIYGTT